MSAGVAGGATAQRALLLDYGGVLTAPVQDAFARFEAELGLPAGRSFALLSAASSDADGGIIGALERGELSVEGFDAHLHRLLTEAGFAVPDGTGLLAGMFAAMQPAGTLWGVAEEVRAQGVRTGLLSNSWGTSFYPFARLEATFDALVLSGEVGLRKPDPRIYALAAQRVGTPAQRCVFVDDLQRNVQVATDLGMQAVHHTGDDEMTRAAVLAALELPPPR